MESPLRLLPLECTQAHSHHEQNKIQTVTVNLTQCDCLYPCPFHITSLFHGRDHYRNMLLLKSRTNSYGTVPLHRESILREKRKPETD
jgi:hypothetical protein